MASFQDKCNKGKPVSEHHTIPHFVAAKDDGDAQGSS